MTPKLGWKLTYSSWASDNNAFRLESTFGLAMRCNTSAVYFGPKCLCDMENGRRSDRSTSSNSIAEIAMRDSYYSIAYLSWLSLLFASELLILNFQ